ncbi:MAG TPA: hypothetical protein VK131_03745, partial [Candidatus Acidoferrales bacterium]|nr:hypothetical protein [Candidatus Acidoferrales bacterium]
NHGCVPTKALVRTARILDLIRDAGRFGIQVAAPDVEWRRAIGRAYQVRDHMLRYGSAPFRESGVEVRYPCRAVMTGERRVQCDGEEVEARAVILAAGLEPAVPPVPGLREAGCLDNEPALDL